ncbi:MAG: right-handed parallel beta-helix repeat-containing protein, partial [Clostridia bacterium]|nr:right-handed parallel beta-helix repeat-containing protein [Clostridia bacterium]
ATMLYRYADFKGYDVTASGDLSKFPDSSKAHSYAKGALAWATGKGLIGGVKSGDKDLLDPRGNATREQFAAILKRFDDAFGEKPLAYNTPHAISQYTEPEYPLVTDADVYVATDGSDSNPGTFDLPVATFERARDLVREIKADTSRPEGEIVVAFKAGVYAAPQNLTFTAEDSGTEASPVVYCKYGDGDVTFSAGVTIPLGEFAELTGAEKEMFPAGSVDRIKKADLTSRGVDPSSLGETNNLFAGSERLDLARWPNKLDNGVDAFTDMVLSISEDERSMTLMSPLRKKVNSYHNVDDMRMFGYYKYDWAASDGPVLYYDPETGFITPTVNGYGIHIFQYAGAPNPYFYFYNIPDELDRPDEYYIDKNTATLYVMDPAEDYTIGMYDSVMRIDGADHLTFRGLDFAYSTGDVINASAVSHILFDRCTFRDVYHYGVDIRGDHIEFRGCEFYEIGYRAIDLRSGDRETLTRGESVIDNCLFDRFGSIGKTMMPAVYAGGCGITVSHNEMCNSANSAVVYSEYIWASNYVTVEYNYIHDVVTQQSDYGAIYAGRNLAGYGSVVRYNLICNVGTPEEGHVSLGVYLDDGQSGQEIYGNIFYDIANHCVFTNGGRDNKIHDNLMISPRADSKAEIHIGGDFDYAEGEKVMDPEWIMILELVPFRNELWASHFPVLARIKYENDGEAGAADDPDFARNPSYDEIYGNAMIISQERIDAGGNEQFSDRSVRFGTRMENSAVYPLTENPFFVDPTAGDYRLRDDADFIPIPVERIGRY